MTFTIITSNGGWSVDALHAMDISKEDTFNYYYPEDPSFKLTDYFIFDNYKIIEFTEDCSELTDTAIKNGQSFNDTSELNQILSTQKVLLITGTYGTGKTSLAKYIFHHLRIDGKNCFFFKAKSIAALIHSCITIASAEVRESIEFDSDKLALIFSSFCNNTDAAYIFIDELEELNIPLKDGDTYLGKFLTWLFSFLEVQQNTHFVLASRKYIRIGDDRFHCIADDLFAEWYGNYTGSNPKLSIVYSSTFLAKTVNEWIDDYLFRNNSPADHTIVKDIVKDTKKAMRTPIFLYAFMRRYIHDSTIGTTNHGYYYYYASFIDETIEGRYGKGQQTAFIRQGGLKNRTEFRLLLCELAYAIFKGHASSFDHDLLSSEILDEQPLLSEMLTEIKYKLPFTELRNYMHQSRIDKANLINCYFFNTDIEGVYFTDTNILFALAAEHIFNSILKVSRNSQPFHPSDLNKIKHLRLYPQLMDYILYLAACLQTTDKTRLFLYLDSFVKNPMVRSHCIDMGDVSVAECILMLYILFLKLNTSAYKTEYAHIFKEILYYRNACVTAYSMQNPNQKYYPVERYLIKTHLHGIQLNRANLKGYNFRDSSISGKFTQCKFQKTNFLHTEMSHTTFKLCSFDKVREFSIVNKHSNPTEAQVVFDSCDISDSSFQLDSARFMNCRIKNVKIQECLHVRFEHCDITTLEIHYKNKRRSSPPEIAHCILNTKILCSSFDDEEMRELIGKGNLLI